MARFLLLHAGLCPTPVCCFLRLCSKKLKWYALCPVVDAINHSSLVEVSLLCCCLPDLLPLSRPLLHAK